MPGHYMGDAFHTYGVLRAADHAEVYWDGKLVTSYKTDDHGGGQSLLLNIGRSGSGPLKLGPGGALRVDYVRAFRPTRA
jgi:hypothetical protein